MGTEHVRFTAPCDVAEGDSIFDPDFFLLVFTAVEPIRAGMNVEGWLDEHGRPWARPVRAG